MVNGQLFINVAKAHAMLLRHPTVNVTVSELTADDIGTSLIAGNIDVGISYRPQAIGKLRFEPLYNEEMVLVVSSEHPFARRKRLRLVELHRQALVLLPETFTTRVMLDECFRACGAEPMVVAEMNSIAPMLGLVERIPIGAVVSEHAVQRHSPLRVIPLESPTPMRTPGIVWKRGEQRTAPMRTFGAIVRQVAMSKSLRRPSA